jgi:hypothetical protein
MTQLYVPENKGVTLGEIANVIPKFPLTLQSPVISLCTTWFNVKNLYVLPTQCIYELYMDRRKTTTISLYNIN